MTRIRLTLIPTSFFKTLVDHEVTVELKNDICIKGILKSVDQFLNIKLDEIQVVEEIQYPHLVSAARNHGGFEGLPVKSRRAESCADEVLDRNGANTHATLVIGEECLHKGERRAIRALTG